MSISKNQIFNGNLICLPLILLLIFGNSFLDYKFKSEVSSVLINLLCASFIFFLAYFFFNKLEQKEKEDYVKNLSSNISEYINGFFVYKIFKSTKNSSINEADLIRKANKEIILVQETGSSLIEKTKYEIIEKIKSGVKVTIVIVSKNEEVLKLMTFRNDTLSIEGFRNRISAFEEHISKIKSKIGDEYIEYLDVKEINYPIGSTYTIIDKNEAILITSGFKVPFEEKIQLHIMKNLSLEYFNYIDKEVSNILNHSVQKK